MEISNISSIFLNFFEITAFWISKFEFYARLKFKFKFSFSQGEIL